MGQRVKVILPEYRKSERTYLGMSGIMTELDRSTGRAQVAFEHVDEHVDEVVTIDACCLQEQDD